MIPKVVQFLTKEFLEMLPPTIFFLVAFHVVVFALALALMAEQYESRLSGYGCQATV